MSVGIVPDTVLTALERHGFLLISDAHLPNIVALTTGAPAGEASEAQITAAWRVAGRLSDHPDVLPVKLVSRKVTWLHRRLWPAFLGAVAAREPWQTLRLAPLSLALLDAVDRLGTVDLGASDLAAIDRRELREAVRAIGVWLAAFTTGTHEGIAFRYTKIERWDVWAARRGLTEAPLPADQAKPALEAMVATLAVSAGAKAKLPWQIAKRGN